MKPRASAWMPALLLASACASCTPAEPDTNGPASDAGGAATLPALHAVLAWEHIVDGGNPQRRDYQGRMDMCREAGWPTRELPSDEVARLGTGRVEIMIDARRQAVRQTMWTLGAGSDGADPKALCQPTLAEEQTEDSSVDGQFPAVTDADMAAEAELVARAGWARVGEDSVGGQACVRWRQDDQEVCMWSGGSQWGFAGQPLDLRGCDGMAIGSYLEYIPLEARALGPQGCVVKLESFSLGKGLLPANLPGPARAGAR